MLGELPKPDGDSSSSPPLTFLDLTKAPHELFADRGCIATERVQFWVGLQAIFEAADRGAVDSATLRDIGQAEARTLPLMFQLFERPRDFHVLCDRNGLTELTRGDELFGSWPFALKTSPHDSDTGFLYGCSRDPAMYSLRFHVRFRFPLARRGGGTG